jgi:hypothetical protein
MTIYHYTTQTAFKLIEKDEYLRPSTEVPMPGERLALWFTTSAEWDNTANKAIIFEGRRVGTRETTHIFGEGLVRIACPDSVAPLDWKAYKSQSGIAPKLAKALFDVAIREGVRPSCWRTTFDCVYRDSWLEVHFWDGKKWSLDRPTITRPNADETERILTILFGSYVG